MTSCFYEHDITTNTLINKLGGKAALWPMCLHTVFIGMIFNRL